MRDLIPLTRNPRIFTCAFPKVSGKVRYPLGLTPGPTCTIQRVKPSQIIDVLRWESGRKRHESFEVAPSFELHTQVIPKSRYREGTGGHQHITSKPLTVEERDLEILFSSDWPEWLTQILVPQLRHWQIHNVEHYYHYSPWSPNEDDIWRCVKGAPYQAMRRYGNRLTPLQWEICCQKSPRGAAAFRLDKLAPYLRMQYLQRYPDEVLRHSAESLSAEEIIKIAKISPDSVLRYYRCMPEKQRALAVSATLTQTSRYFNRHGTLSRSVLLESLKEFPEEWLIGGGGDFGKILSALENVIGSINSGAETFSLHHKLGAASKEAFFRAVSERI